ncbi:MAG: homoserine kinase [Chloroflexi bacterium]|nr:homoserine kinase [Chloroflexota bacterium]
MHTMRRRSVTVQVPATTANLGPGFDVLGMALDTWNQVGIRMGGPAGVSVCGEGVEKLSRSRDNLVYRAACRLFAEVGQSEPELSIACKNAIPLARGLGSSAAAVVGGLVAANALLGEPLPQERLLLLATEMEGHPDNVAPALLGGCRIVVRDGDRLIAAAVPLPADLRCVVYVPDQPLSTDEMRRVLAREVTREEAVFNMGRVALLVNALATGDLGLLAVATQDRLHQPARQEVFPAMKHIIRAAMEAGALGAFLSGSGSSVLALTKDREMTIGYEMADAASKANAPGTFKVMCPSAQGAHVIAIE